MAHHYHNPNPIPAINWQHAASGWAGTPTSVVGGFDVNGETLYVGRVLHQGDVIPGKVVPSHGCCYIPWGGQEHGLRNFQVLHTRPGVEMVWIPTSGREIPTGAIQGGATADGEPLFIGRHEHEGSYVVGKIQPSHEVLYVAFGGQEVPYRDYEILCLKHLPL